jgi:hypothetical protein
MRTTSLAELKDVSSECLPALVGEGGRQAGWGVIMNKKLKNFKKFK